MPFYSDNPRDKAHLRPAWSAREFDFELACRVHGRNNAFWILCYRAHLDGDPLPDEREAKRLIRAANRATGGLNRDGETERYTLYEAKATIAQVSRYRSHGLRVITSHRRRWIRNSRSKRANPYTKRLLEAICQVAEMSGRTEEFTASHRQLAKMADLHPTQVAHLLYSLEEAKQVVRKGFTPARNGQPRGTTRLSLKPERPFHNIDEREKPVYDVHKDKWVWSSPLAKGKISYSTWRWLASRAASLPNVYEDQTHVASAFRTPLVTTIEIPSRGSP